MRVDQLHEAHAKEMTFRRQFSELVARFKSLVEASTSNPNIDCRQLRSDNQLLAGFQFIGNTALAKLAQQDLEDDGFYAPIEDKEAVLREGMGIPVYTATVMLANSEDTFESISTIDAVYLERASKTKAAHLYAGCGNVVEYYERLSLPGSQYIGEHIILPNGVLERSPLDPTTYDPQEVIKHDSYEEAIASLHGSLDIIEGTPNWVPTAMEGN